MCSIKKIQNVGISYSNVSFSFQISAVFQTRVHRNLVVSLIIHSVLLMIIPSTVIFRSTFPTYTDVVRRLNSPTKKALLVFELWGTYDDRHSMRCKGVPIDGAHWKKILDGLMNGGA
ncbi:hypothetical protein CEXT_744621 [Caerostris extrusa]|uniref:Uncharacterized protein n=1 Tax=Caerostris extrusa TaxID=172846 RepID=A0AAV4RJ72_CAEEX|nr:hypothetical protein CEXT_744621 [Caerostris extrusa]